MLWGPDDFGSPCGRNRAFGAILGHQPRRVAAMLLLLINIVIIVVVGAIVFYLIDKYVRDGRLGNLLKILVALICLAAILQRLLPIMGVGF
jgi:uncharacterized membrane protein required for colicin V production